MSSTPLLFGHAERETLAALARLAIQHPVDMRGLAERLKDPAKKAAHRDHMTAQTVTIPAAFMVTFSIEHGHPGGSARHVSISVDKDGRVPNEQAVYLIARALGFTGELTDWTLWLEDLQGHGKAVNAVQLIAAHH